MSRSQVRILVRPHVLRYILKSDKTGRYYIGYSHDSNLGVPTEKQRKMKNEKWKIKSGENFAFFPFFFSSHLLFLHFPFSIDLV